MWTPGRRKDRRGHMRLISIFRISDGNLPGVFIPGQSSRGKHPGAFIPGQSSRGNLPGANIPGHLSRGNLPGAIFPGHLSRGNYPGANPGITKVPQHSLPLLFSTVGSFTGKRSDTLQSRGAFKLLSLRCLRIEFPVLHFRSVLAADAFSSHLQGRSSGLK
jgi:hypothetical protein